MNIGFDAKRAYHNGTGLGNYSRTLLQSLAADFPAHQYYLFNPKPSNQFEIKGNNIHEILPGDFLNKLFRSAWRSKFVTKDLQRLKIDLYHGLSHEIPAGIQKTGIKSVVTIHDLIHERYPGQYNPIDVKIYSRKFRYACEHADKIIAISEQTKKDIIDFYKVPADKIETCYQSCNPVFNQVITREEKNEIKARYDLPEKYFLYVGSIIERKNLLNICKAMVMLNGELDIPLVVIGSGGKYFEKVKAYIQQNGLSNKVLFLSGHPASRTLQSFHTAADFPAIYQGAIAMIYPSSFEGFGIPVIEALWSRLPVITSFCSSLPEAGGNAAYYVNPESAEEIANGMKSIYADPVMAASMAEKGWMHAQVFTQQKSAAAVMNVYKKLW